MKAETYYGLEDFCAAVALLRVAGKETLSYRIKPLLQRRVFLSRRHFAPESGYEFFAIVVDLRFESAILRYWCWSME